MKYKKFKACVLIYSAMGLYEEAVDLAILVDISYAKINAEKPTEDIELRKKLWLRIAKHVVSQEQDIKKAMEFLKECPLLKIEEILPFFSNFTVIDYFKDEICQSLTKYNSEIDELKSKMDEATSSARLIRDDIKMMRNRFVTIQSSQICSLCGSPLLQNQFYLFPCSHSFHSDCLFEFVEDKLDNVEKNKLRVLQLKITEQEENLRQKAINTTEDISNAPKEMEGNEVNELDSLRNEFDDIVASDCIFCGFYMIDSIDSSLISNLNQNDKKEWMV